MHPRNCHACNQPIEPLSGCIGRFGDDDLRHYHTACFAGVAVMKPKIRDAGEAEQAPAQPEAVASPKVRDLSPKKFAWFEKGEVVFTDTRRSSVFVGVIARDGGDTGVLSRAIEEESIDCDMGLAAELAFRILKRIAVDLETEDVAVAMVHEGKQVHSFKSGAFASPGWQSDLFGRHRGAKLTPQPCN